MVLQRAWFEAYWVLEDCNIPYVLSVRCVSVILHQIPRIPFVPWFPSLDKIRQTQPQTDNQLLYGHLQSNGSQLFTWGFAGWLCLLLAGRVTLFFLLSQPWRSDSIVTSRSLRMHKYGHHSQSGKRSVMEVEGLEGWQLRRAHYSAPQHLSPSAVRWRWQGSLVGLSLNETMEILHLPHNSAHSKTASCVAILTFIIMRKKQEVCQQSHHPEKSVLEPGLFSSLF